jgi:hypothetical protein
VLASLDLLFAGMHASSAYETVQTVYSGTYARGELFRKFCIQNLACLQVHNGRGVRLIDLDAAPESQKVHSTKVVQRSWYESNKHIFPANRWELFDELKHIER